MRRRTRITGGVKRSDVRKKTIFHREKTGLALTDGCRRIRGYLLGCFSQGKEYHDWNKHQFHRCTESLNPLSVRHIERIVGYYRRRCTEFNWLPIRVGRSTRFRVVLADPDNEPVTIPEVRRRLVGYIASTVAKNGVAHVDEEFLRHFWRATQLPPELIHLVWLKTKKMAGFRVRWRGVNSGRKMVVSRFPSPTHFRPGPFSTHFVSEGIKPKTGGLTPPFGGSSASLRAASQDADSGSTHRLPTSDAEEAARDVHPPPEERALRAPEFDRRFDGMRPSPSPPRPGGPPPQPKTGCRKWPPLAVAGRFVSGEKLARLATLLAVTSMRNPHDEFYRVKWIFVYPRNFAWRALREGFGVPEILAAYAAGVRRSHEDSLDRDRSTTADGEFLREPVRVPSSAVSYALAQLLEDPRDREERWAEIFARGPRAAPPVAPADVRDAGKRIQRARVSKTTRGAAAAAEVGAGPTVPDPTPKASQSTRRPRSSVAELRALLARQKSKPETAAPAAVELTAGELVAWLKEHRDMTAAQFAAWPYAVRQKLIAACREWKRSQSLSDL
jgi:hypothetical protein